MKIYHKTPPRKFSGDKAGSIIISDCGDIHLEPNEQITFVTDEGARSDFTRKDWGFYATASVNARVRDEGFKTALVCNNVGRIFIMLVEMSQKHLFDKYCQDENQEILAWFDEYDEGKNFIEMKSK